MSVHLHDRVGALRGRKNGKRGKQDAQPATRTPGASALVATGTGLVCLLAYAWGISSGATSVDLATRPFSGGLPRAEASTPPETPAGAEPPGLIESVRRLQLEDAVGFVADDGLGTVTGELAVLVAPVGTPVWRLRLTAAFLGALTASLLVAAMLRLGVARVAAVASALSFAFCAPFWQGALMAEPSMIRAPMLGLTLFLLTLWTDRRRLPWLPVTAFGLWGLCAVAEPMLLCVLPAMAAFICLVERRRPTCTRLTVLTAVAAGFVLSQLLAANDVGVRTWTGAANVVRPDTLVAELGVLGLVFLAAAALEVCRRPTREELLAFVGWLGVMGWTLSAETIDGRQLATAFVLTCPVVGFGMSAFLRSSPRGGLPGAAWLLCLVLPASNYARGVEPAAEQGREHAHWTAYARALADTLPERAVVVTTPNVHEPIASLWRFPGAGGRRVVDMPLDVRRVRELHEELPIFAFEPTRTHLELLGFRFSILGRVRADASRERDGDRRILARLRRQPISRLASWETCAAVGAQGWASVANVVVSGTVGIRFGSHARDATLALYVAAGDRLPEIDQAVASGLPTRIGWDDFDRRDPGDAATLDRLLAVDGVSPRQFRSSERYVQRVHASRDSHMQPLAAIRIGGRPASAIARLVRADDGEPVIICSVPS